MHWILILIIGLFVPLGIIAQSEELYIEIRSDGNPKEITWQLTDDSDQILITDSSKIIEPNKVYISTIQLTKGECYRFDIFDSGGDGIAAPGYYRLRREEVWIQGQHHAYGLSNFHYTGKCPKGMSCDDPMPVTSVNMYSYSTADYWYHISEPENIGLELSTCSSRDENNNELDTELWVYDRCPEQIGDGPEGALIYNDDYVTCSPGAGLFRLDVKADRDYFIRVRVKDTTVENQLVTTFVKYPNITGCTDSKSCNYNPLATEEDGSCVYDDCLPDLAIGQSQFKSSIKLDKILVEDNCLIEEACVTGLGSRDVVRFSTVIYNIGTADYIVGNPESSNEIFSINNCHGHWHQLGYAEYLLFSGAGNPEPIGFKNGFCLLDIKCDEGSTQKYSCAYMGVTAGCYDVYDSSVECQWIDVTEVPDGEYTLVARINWRRQPDMRGMKEITYDNNWVQSCISLDRSSGVLEMTIMEEEECKIYKDCLGIINGQAVLDCTGICGGNAHFGDVNQDNEISYQDVSDYIETLTIVERSVSPCLDLDGDDQLSVYDITLLRECLLDYDNDEYHTHCLFPKSVFNEIDSAGLNIQDYNPSKRTIDIAYTSIYTPLIAMDFNITGINQIESLEPLGGHDFSFYSGPEGRVFGISNNSNLPMTTTAEPMVRVTYTETTHDEICISSITEIINVSNQRITSIVSDNSCEVVSNTIDINDAIDISIWPNPVTSFLTLSFSEKLPEQIVIYNTRGEIENSIDTVTRRTLDIELEELSKGIYFVQIQFENRIVISKVIVL